jgi:hypothetical protein
MPSTYTGSDTGLNNRNDVTVSNPVDADPPNAASVNTPLEKLANYLQRVFKKAGFLDLASTWTALQTFTDYIGFTGSNPATTTAQSNTLAKTSVVKAWARCVFDSYATDISNIKGWNVASVTRDTPQEDAFQVTLASGMAAAESINPSGSAALDNFPYVVFAQLGKAGGASPMPPTGTNAAFAEVTQQSATQFQIRFFTHAGVLVNLGTASEIFVLEFFVLGYQ